MKREVMNIRKLNTGDIPMESRKEKRQEAMSWWHKLTFEEKFFKVIEWLFNKGKDTTSRHPDNLTGREIEQIHNETKRS
jgi:hypothetical protein